MIKFLIKSTNAVRVESKEAADELHKQIMNETLQNGWILSAWTEKHKEKKQKGEVVEEWVLVTYTITFQEEKEPLEALSSIEYNTKRWESVEYDDGDN